MNAILHIRKEVLGVTQAELARAIGRPQGTISRWETGELKPDLSDLLLLRTLLKAHKKKWRDEWFFEVPQSETQPETAA